jgi:meso-butanediol dehydrogenase/(S,S)-butanediol dehydrogenase/diacetyl reductase
MSSSQASSQPSPLTTSRFAGKRAVVTGAASGIGRAVARRLAEEGAEVVGFDLDAQGLRETFASVSDGRAVVVDVASAEAVAALGQAGRVDVLVNAAGVLMRHGVLEHPLEDWRRTLEVNVKAPLRLSRELARGHIERAAAAAAAATTTATTTTTTAAAAAADDDDERSASEQSTVDGHAGAAIVNIGSIESFTALPGHAAYTASKTALLMLTRAFALELAPHGIRVNCLAPGVTETGMNALLRADPMRAEQLLAAIPLGRFATPEEQAAGVCFLACEEAAYITGATLPIDGGWLAR